jgi:hypothetical protein
MLLVRCRWISTVAVAADVSDGFSVKPTLILFLTERLTERSAEKGRAFVLSRHGFS